MKDDNSKHLEPKYGYIPKEGLDYAGRRFHLGALKYSPFDYQERDIDFYQDRKKHLKAHLDKYLEGDMEDDNLAAVICNAMILAWYEEHKAEVLIRSYDALWTKLKGNPG